MPGYSRALFHSLLAALMAVAVVACGGGGGGGGGDSVSDGASSLPASSLGSTGSVAMTLTDHPSDYFDKVVAIISRAELIGDPGRFTLFQGTKRFDLLRLRDESVPLTFGSDVPTGLYRKIRLTLDDLILVPKGSTGNPEKWVHPKLPGNHKLDLVFRDGLFVAPDRTVLVQLDMDVEKSIHIIKTGNRLKYNFRPVIFVEVVDGAFPGKLVRLEGTIERISTTRQAVLLCGTDNRADHDYDAFEDSRADNGDENESDDRHDDDRDRHKDCVAVLLADASLFDDHGDPIRLSQVQVGDEATAVGLLRTVNDQDFEDDGHDAYGHDDDSDDGYHDDDDDRRMLLDAIVLELGSPLTVKGTVTESADGQPGEFGLVNVQGTEGTVILQRTTRIVSPTGKPLSFEDITEGRSVTVDGYRPDPATPTQLKGTLVIVDRDDVPVAETRASGTVQSVDRNGFGMVADEPPCTLGVTDIRVNADAEADIYLVTFPADPNAPPLSRRIRLGELTRGQRVDVYGSCSRDGAVDAEDVIAFEGTPPDGSF